MTKTDYMVKTELLSQDVLNALRHMDAEELFRIQCDANDAAAQAYDAHYKEHPNCDQLPEFAIEFDRVSGFAPAVDAAVAVFEQAVLEK